MRILVDHPRRTVWREGSSPLIESAHGGFSAVSCNPAGTDSAGAPLTGLTIYRLCPMTVDHKRRAFSCPRWPFPHCRCRAWRCSSAATALRFGPRHPFLSPRLSTRTRIGVGSPCFATQARARQSREGRLRGARTINFRSENGTWAPKGPATSPYVLPPRQVLQKAVNACRPRREAREINLYRADYRPCRRFDCAPAAGRRGLRRFRVQETCAGNSTWTRTPGSPFSAHPISAPSRSSTNTGSRPADRRHAANPDPPLAGRVSVFTESDRRTARNPRYGHGLCAARWTVGDRPYRFVCSAGRR